MKAIEEGATALDAFAVPSERFPDGFLPDFYGSFGFEEVGRIDFDPSFYSQTELADLEDYWRSTGWNLEAAQGGRSVGDPAGNLGGAGLGSGSLAPDRLAAVARELLTLPDAAVENLGIDPSRLTQVRDDLGLFR